MKFIWRIWVLAAICIGGANAAAAGVHFKCKTHNWHILRTNYYQDLEGYTDESGIPKKIVISQMTSKTVEMTCDEGRPVEFYSGDPDAMIFNRFDVNGTPGTGGVRGAFFFALPKADVTTMRHFKARLDVIFGGGNYGWWSIPMLCAVTQQSI